MKVRISPEGHIYGLWDDRLELPRLGPVQVRRASYIEFNHKTQQWCVCAARPGGWLAVLAWYLLPGRRRRVLFRAASRAEALKWEVEYFAAENPSIQSQRG